MFRRIDRRHSALVFALALPILAQNHPDSSPSQVSAALSSSFIASSGVQIAGMPIEAFRRNQPLSLTLASTNIQKLADGTMLNHTGRSRLYRDSSGRLRLETFYDSGQPFTITILDPLAGKVWYLRVVGKQALSMDSEGSRMMQALAARTGSANIRPPRRGETSEPLPAKTIQGFATEGARHAWTLPTGTSGVGNDRPIDIVMEEWFSPQLGIDLERSTNDPRSGKSTVMASDIQLKEPDPALFQVPSDYKLVSN